MVDGKTLPHVCWPVVSGGTASIPRLRRRVIQRGRRGCRRSRRGMLIRVVVVAGDGGVVVGIVVVAERK